MTAFSVNLRPMEFPLHEDFDLPALDTSSPLTRLTERLVEVISRHPDVASPTVLLDTSAYPGIEFPAADTPIDIDILLCSSTEALADWNNGSAAGVFMTTGSPLEERMFATRLRVGVPCDMEALRAFVLEERQEEMNPDSDQHDQSYLEAYLCTLTHELAHAIDFIRHTGGLTPDEVDLLYDDGEIDFDISEAATGVLARPEMAPLRTHPERAEEAMEERVEALGRQWLRWALQHIDQELIQECLQAIRPMDMAIGQEGPSF